MVDVPPTSPHKTVTIGAASEHKQEISRFLNQNNLTHLHLDWFNPLDWLGQHPFLLDKHQEQIQAVMLAVPEVSNSSWVRLFSVKNDIAVQDVWERLLKKTETILKDQHINQLGTLGLSDWITGLLIRSNFYLDNKIVVLEWIGDSLPKKSLKSQIDIRSMCLEDLPAIEKIDHLAFASLWQNSLEGLTKAFNQPGFSTVATQQNQIIGYQISTAVTIQGHLARLAVHPDHQGQQVGTGLVVDLLSRMLKNGIHNITVNTQYDNFSSLAIYQKLGFNQTQETIPVYVKHL